MNKQQPLLQINNLSLAYGAKEILKSVQLTVCPGEILGIVGSSGGARQEAVHDFSGPYSIFISPTDDRLANLHYAAGTGAVRYGRQPAVCRAGACRARFF